MKKLTKKQQKLILREAKIILCDSISALGICNGIAHAETTEYLFGGRVGVAFVSCVIPSFTFKNVERICLAYGLPTPELSPSGYWWSLRDIDTRVKVINYLIDEL